ncbi:MAG: LamG-like jellyroll fold domain-containing protein, partial [Dehalococcoidales bacterium]|nr:LamG-like jellyroll fold domain-containing protein [Dehalococcoidales bacterium]
MNAPNLNNYLVRIGAAEGGSGIKNIFRGSIDDTRIYSRALSASEITQLYKLGAAKLAVSPVNSLTKGLVGYWTFDGKDTNWSTGIVSDKSGQGNNGSLINMSTSTSPIAGKIGQALSFNGNNSHVDMTSAPGANNYTYAAWFYTRSFINGTATGGTGTYFVDRTAGGGNPLASLKAVAGAFAHQYRCDDSSGIGAVSGSAITINTWKYVVWGRSGTEEFIYVNNVKSSTTLSCASLTPDVPRIGIHQGLATATAFNGLIDDVRFYNRALSQAEVTQLYKQGAAKLGVSPVNSLTTGLVGYWTFDGKSTNWRASTTTDLSGNGNEGRMTNMSTTTSPVPGKLGQGLKFDKVDDYVNVGSSASLNNMRTYTVSAWIYPRSFGASSVGRIYDKNSTAGRILFLCQTTACAVIGDITNSVAVIQGFATDGKWDAPSNSIVLNTWTHVAVTYNNPSGLTTVDPIIYINGVSVAVTKISTPVGAIDSDSGASMLIGIDPSFNFPFDGTIDDFRVYNRILSATEITQLYKQG